MSVSSDLIEVAGALAFKREGAEVPVDIPSNGVLQVSVLDGASVTLGGGGALQLCGIEYLDVDGVSQVVLPNNIAHVKLFRAATGVGITVLNNRSVDLLANPLPEVRRILTSSGKDFGLETINAQAFFSYSPAAIPPGFRWFFVDRLNYDPNPANYVAPPPDTIPAALGRMEGALVTLLGAPIP